MPEFPNSFDAKTLMKKFNMMDTMDPKGAALNNDVCSFTQRIVNNAFNGF
jgi:hypothetical protein